MLAMPCPETKRFGPGGHGQIFSHVFLQLDGLLIEGGKTGMAAFGRMRPVFSVFIGQESHTNPVPAPTTILVLSAGAGNFPSVAGSRVICFGSSTARVGMP